MKEECENQIDNFMWGKLCNQGEELQSHMQSCHNLNLYNCCPKKQREVQQ